MKLRFSIRGLFLLTACLAAFLYWRDRPRRVANQFVAALEARDYELAASMFPEIAAGLSASPSRKWSVKRDGQSITDWLRGRYPLTVRMVYGGANIWFMGVDATAAGLTVETTWPGDAPAK